ncbi:MAG TPA: hypothetical protein VJQ42_07180 [Rhodanobacteraceae bacterium]|nr:hypothetical protein [Rhodanobacteraceae bacterium]
MPIRPEMRGRYPADWKLRSRFVRMVRSRGRCEWCGVQQYAVVLRGSWRVVDQHASYAEARQDVADKYASSFGLDATDPCPWTIVVLTTAHVHDQRPEAASLLNLAALCQRCHNRHDLPMRRANAQARRRQHTPDLFPA